MSTLVLLMALIAGFPAAPLPQDPPPEQEAEAAEPAPEAEAAAEAEEKKEEPAEEESPWLAIVGGDVHTVTRGVITGGTVLVRDGRIEALGAGIPVPEGARVVDAAGMQVYPGLVAADSSGILPGGEKMRDSFDPFSLSVDLALSSGITTLQSGGTVGKPTRGTLEGMVLNPRAWVSLNYSTTSPSGRRKLRASLDKVRAHLREKGEYERAKERGEEDLEEPGDKGLDKNHLRLLTRQATARFNANSMKDLLAVTDLLEEYPMDAVVFGGMEAWTVAPRLGRAGARLVITPRRKSWADERLNRPSGWKIENARILHGAGVEFAVVPASTFISTGGIAGRDLLTLPMEAAFAIRGGLPQEAALRAITLGAAGILGVEGRVGSLEPGKDADIIITDGDLFDYRTFVQWTFVNGRLVYDKQAAPYFAHIRPRPEPTPAEIVDAVIEAVEEAVEEPQDGGQEDGDPDRPEGGP